MGPINEWFTAGFDGGENSVPIVPWTASSGHRPIGGGDLPEGTLVPVLAHNHSIGSESYESLANSITWLNKYEDAPPIVGDVVKEDELDTDWAKNLDIYSLLREFTSMTTKLSSEARAVRVPLISRDEELLTRGFMAQSRMDFLVLRRS